MVIFGAHTFVKYANNLYTPKILSLKMTITHYSGNIPGYLQNKQTVSQLHNRELSISSVKYPICIHFPYQKHMKNNMALHAVNLELNSLNTLNSFEICKYHQNKPKGHVRKSRAGLQIKTPKY